MTSTLPLSALTLLTPAASASSAAYWTLASSESTMLEPLIGSW